MPMSMSMYMSMYMCMYLSVTILMPMSMSMSMFMPMPMYMYNVLMSVFNDGKSHDKHKDWRSGSFKLRAQAIDLMYVNHFQKNGNCYISNPVKVSHKELFY